MQQADVGMQHAGHRLAGRLGIAMGDADRMILVQAQQHAGIFIAQMVDEGIVQAAIAGTRIEAHIFEPEAPHHLRRNVAAKTDLVVDLSLRTIRPHADAPFGFCVS